MSDLEQKLRYFMPFGGTAPIVRLQPGEVFFDPAPHRLATLLGSCVAVCLWDESKRMGGMTHSLIPTGGKGKQDKNLHATDASVHELVKRMIQAGCRTSSLQAKLFGGFSPMKLALKTAIGAANIESAMRVLRGYDIDIVAKEILGEGGIVIYQNTATGEVSGRRIAPLTLRA
jgi:chemotaxis protein CheD